MKLKILFTFLLINFFISESQAAGVGINLYVRAVVNPSTAKDVRAAIISDNEKVIADLIDPSDYHLTMVPMTLTGAVPPAGPARGPIITNEIKPKLCEYLSRLGTIEFSTDAYSPSFGNHGVLVIKPDSLGQKLNDILPANPHISLIRSIQKVKKWLSRGSHIDAQKMNEIKFKFTEACADLAVGNTVVCTTWDWCTKNKYWMKTVQALQIP
jgi:hypothetical protein